MRNALVVWLVFLGIFAGCNGNESPATVFSGARLIDGNGGEPIEDAVIVVRDGIIDVVGNAGDVPVPLGATIIDLSGKTVIPGLINTHGHVGGTRGLETGHYDTDNLLRQLRLYARYGVTTVNSLGGDQAEAVTLRDAQNDAGLDRSRIFVAGDVIADTSMEVATGLVERNASLGVDFIKMRVDDNLGSIAKMPESVFTAVTRQAHENGLPVAAHLYYLADAKALVNAGVDFLVHSVRDVPMDQEFIDAMRERNICYTPTLTRELSTYVYENEPDFFSDPFFLSQVDPQVLDQLRDPDYQSAVRERSSAQTYKAGVAIASANLYALAKAGVRVAMGTDTGPPGRFQGYFEHLELEMMERAGMSPMEIIVASTSTAASCIGAPDIGSIETGKWADFVVLNEDPLDAIVNTRSISSVWIAGNEVPSPTSS